VAGRLARGNDADDFVRTILPIGMDDNQKNHFLRDGNGVPSPFAVSGSLDEVDAVWIVENQLSRLKIDTVFDEVALVLVLVPYEAQHAYVQISMYGDGWKAASLPRMAALLYLESLCQVANQPIDGEARGVGFGGAGEFGEFGAAVVLDWIESAGFVYG